LLDASIMVPLEGSHEFTFGRLSDGQPVMPDVDLSAYNAYENGVSRLHAVVKLDGEQLTIMDLGSSNGTYVNGARLLPNKEHRISSGDLVALGKLKFQIVLTPK
jgi:pSer/pThr/pTyr-binding forkhead associated (FHA) protein